MRDNFPARPIAMPTGQRPQPSQPGGPIIARQRLLAHLAQARHRRCVVFQGPAGCGKTTTIAAWRRELVAVGVEVAWVALGRDDDDVARFFNVLFAGLAAVAPAFVSEASLLAGRGSDEQAIERVVIALVRAIDAFPREIALVFDDVHHLRDPRITMALQLLLDYGPAKLQCVFATRDPLPVSLARLRAQGQVLEIGFDELRFTLAESAQLLTSLLGEIDERELRSLHELTDGWAAGLKLVSIDLRRGPNAAVAAGVRVQDAQTFARYLEREVLSRLSPFELKFLVRCAIPEHFNAALCAALLDELEVTASSADLLSRLEGRGLFIVPAGPRYPEGWRRMHPLLRDALLPRLQALPEAERCQLHTTAWEWFAAAGMQHEAVQHALLAGEEQAAADLVEQRAIDLFMRGELRLLVGLVRQLPDAIVRQRTGLRLWMGWVQVYEHRLEDCRRSIARLRADMAQAAPAERFRLTLLRGLHAVQSDDTAGAMAILPDLLNAPDDADGIALTGRRNLLTWIYLYRGDYEKARRVQLELHAPPVQGQPLLGTPFGVLAGRCLVGLTHAVEGQMIQAERIYRDVLFEAEQRGASCIEAACLAAGLLGEVLYELNDTAAASRLLEERVDVLERVSIPDTVLRVMLVLGRSRWLAGRPLDAFAHLERVEDYAEQMGLDRLLAYSLLEQLRFRLRLNDPAAARALVARLDEIDARHAHAEDGALSEIHVAAERGRIELCMHGADLQKALARLDALSALCRRRGRVRRIPYLHLQSAAIERQLGNGEKSRAHVGEALRLGHWLGLVRTLLDAHEDALLLIQELGREAQLDPLLSFYAERLQAAARNQHTAAETGPARHLEARRGPVEALSPREAEIVDLLSRAMSNKKIARALDLSIDTVKWHLKNIYGKLGVSGRDEVVERMRDAGLV